MNAAIEAMEAEARRFVRDGVRDAPTETRLTAFMRYAGQGWEIPVPIPVKRFGEGDAEDLRKAFEKAYAALFGRVIDGLAVGSHQLVARRRQRTSRDRSRRTATNPATRAGWWHARPL